LIPINKEKPAMRSQLIVFTLTVTLMCISCKPNESNGESALQFSPEMAAYLYQFAFNCIDQQYPNKPGVVLGDETYIRSPQEMHPAFYGCFDWHSAVHGHWTLVTLLKQFPDFEHKEKILAKLQANITRENIQQEILFFDDEHNKTFQRTYGWAWLLKLAEALREWDHPTADAMYQNLRPLEELLAQQFIEFLDVLNYPIRVGEHSNIAFGMSFAYDYAIKYHPDLARQIEIKAREYFINDRACPLTWEPGGFDFLSPCLQEASLMLKVLPRNEFNTWFEAFLPGFANQPDSFLEPAIVTDASDGKLAHLDGLNFSRAWCLFEMGHAMHNKKMINLGVAHFNYSYEKMDADEYAGSHWLASFATYALIKSSGE
jgi:hypothetical protein